MSLQPTITSSVQGIPVFIETISMTPGGHILDTTGLLAGAVVPAGTPVALDDISRIAKVCKTVATYADVAATDKVIRVNKGHLFQVGDNISAAVGGIASVITAIDSSNDSYDIITVDTVLGVLTVGAVLFESTDKGATDGKIKNLPNGLLYNDAKVADGEDVVSVLRGTVYARRIPPLTDDMQASLKGFLFNGSY